MRDKLMNEQYFSEFINEELERINRFNTKLRNNEVREDRIYSVKKKIDSLKFGVLVAKYSYGEDLNRLKTDFVQLLNDMPLYWNNNSSYVEMLWMMSLAILFDASKEQFSVLSDLVLKYKYNDALLQFMTRYKLEGIVGKIEEEYLFSVPYEKLTDVIANKEHNSDILKNYLLKHWYVGHKDAGWYGYWSFEAGAIAKILNIDDSSLKDVQYYPYDLVHYKAEE